MIRVPPGRSGQVWLRRRLETARRGIDILGRKQRLLAIERERRDLQATSARSAWMDACAEAERWSTRALRLGHENQVAVVAANLGGPASVTIAWHNVMAVSIPDNAHCTFPNLTFASASGGSSATDRAVEALAEAVQKGAAHAAIQRALANIDAELQQTSRRLRLLEHRRLPQLEQALRESRERLEEREREDTLRLRWARGG